MRPLLALAVAPLLLLAVAAGAAPPAGVAAQIVGGVGFGGPIHMSLLGYTPTVTILNHGDSVTWINHDGGPVHTATNPLGGDPNSGPVQNNGQYTATFPNTGVVLFQCQFHPWMVGALVVV
jgi:plastocyanin